MTLSAPSSLFTAVTSAAATSNSSASFTPVAGDLILIAATSRITTHVHSISNTHAGVWTWTKVEISNALANETVLSLFMAICPASPGAGTVTVTSSVASALRWRLTGHKVSTTDGVVPTNTKTKNDASATPSLTLTNAPSATSMTVGWVSSAGVTSPAIGPGSGFTELVEVGDAVATSLEIEYDDTAPGASLDWTGCATAGNCLIAIECKLLKFTAAVAATAVAATASVTAKQKFKATVAATAVAASAAVTAKQKFSSAIAATAAAASAALTAKQKFSAALTATAQPASATVTAKQKFSAAIAATAQPANASATAKQKFSAAVAATGQPASASLTAKQRFSAAIAATGQPANASVIATNTAPSTRLPEHAHRRPRPIGIGMGFGL